MNLVFIILAFPALIFVFVVSDESWQTFSNDFPLFTNATAGPYVHVIASIFYAYTIKRTFDQVKESNNRGSSSTDPLNLVGIQLAALTTLGVSFLYSFDSINESIDLKYFLLVVLLLFSGFFGLLQFTAEVKQLDRDSTNTDSLFLSTVLDLKRLLHDSLALLKEVEDKNYLKEQLTILSELDDKKDLQTLVRYLHDLVRWIEHKEDLRLNHNRFKTILEGLTKK